MRISDFIQVSNKARTPPELVGMFERATSQYGFTKIAYADLTSGSHNRPEMPGFLVSYPEDWVKHYFERQYERIDPSTQHLFVSRGPFTWEELPEIADVTKKQARFMEEARGAGLKAGLSIPLHGPMGSTSAIALASDTDNTDAESHKHTLQALAVQFHTVYAGLHSHLEGKAAPVRLTPRERECLQWCANGKSSWEIGVILSISEHGASFHLKNAMAKLNVTSRIAAVVKAIRLGLIAL